MKNYTNEVKTGLTIIAAILVSIFLWSKTTNFYSDTYKLKTRFTAANGIKENAIVALAGIEVGRVESIKFIYEPKTKVELVLVLDSKAKVRSDSIAFIGTSGFIGDAFVGITTGSANEFLKNNATLASEDPVEMRELMKRADGIAKNLDIVLADVKTIVSDNKDKIDGIVVNLEETTANFNAFSADIKKHPWKLLFKGKARRKGDRP
ncbi:MAG: MlaD family protein [Omnitrophica bacterium]|nr:MlaD family protein [Candidatus Omnitrophota bacterium]